MMAVKVLKKIMMKKIIMGKIILEEKSSPS
jgi:hypothetical protein